ncbi:hypothetical protein CAPTEDRAFT_223730 [Capitella teleta]|uniref:Uncharacterized protein n=1 Tax=Capitella teleta TaxID=283909 RepID=R7U176_CAPTE|nr:hypothetical protein CAPTEDRAFT_223730 [Capitella teleta]|eukprot:ELT99963.1 hypothetical protein CAPTEDRAFT_223730 [Capitella teleta]
MTALRAVLVLLSISCIGAFHPLHDLFMRQVPPQDHEDAPNPFKYHFKRGQPGLQMSQPCTAVTTDLMALIDYQNSLVPFNLLDFLTFMTGVDASNTNAVNQIVCHFLGELHLAEWGLWSPSMFIPLKVDSTDDFLSFLRTSGIERFVIRRMYDYSVVGMQVSMSYDYPGSDSTRNKILMFFQSGFTDLDPVGVEEMAVVMHQAMMSDTSIPDINNLLIPERDTPVTCADFQALFADLMNTPYFMLPSFITPTQIQGMICEIFFAGSIDEIQEVLDSNRVFEELLDFGKMQLRSLKHALPYFERLASQDVADPIAEPWKANYIRNMQLSIKLLRSLEAAGAL